MKVLFAVSNEEISEAIVKRYQKQYKEIISYKNVYYFNAILKEIQKDKTYDRIVISEELEAFTNTQYEQIDRFIFDKLDSISDEASNTRGDNTPIILICSDRRTKGEEMLVKLFGIGIYDALLGNDRGVEEVCNLIHKSRSKKEAKLYYKIEADEVKYQSENENDVSEQEIQNIIAHYKKLGKNEDKYVTSFDNIVAQYNDAQLRIISKFLPLNVRAVLEEKSPKYQQVMSFNNAVTDSIRKPKKPQSLGPSGKLLRPKNKAVMPTEPIVIPNAVDTANVKKLTRKSSNNQDDGIQGLDQSFDDFNTFQDFDNNQDFNTGFDNSFENNTDTNFEETKNYFEDDMFEDTIDSKPMEDNFDDLFETEQEVEPKRRGRPRKKESVVESTENVAPKRRGRPRKNAIPESEDDNILPGFDSFNMNNEPENNYEDDNLLPGINNSNYESNNVLPGFDDMDDEEDSILPGIDNNVNKTKPNKSQNNTFNNNQSNNYDPFSNGQQYDPFGNNNGQYDPFGNNAGQYNPFGNNGQQYNSFDSDFNNQDTSKEYDNNKNVNKNYDIEPVEDVEQYEEETSDNNSFDNVQFDSKLNNPFDDVQFNNNAFNANENQRNQTYGSSMPSYDLQNNDFSRLLTDNKKIVTFVGTSKNGTSFIVNNLAEYASSMGINVAILDTTKNKNSFYIYTKNEEELRQVASKTLENLNNGLAKGISVNKYLTVYTSLPEDREELENVNSILETLVRVHDLILIDCDFDTPYVYFANSHEIYLVQSYDILTIQPLTAFMRELKAQNILDESKLKILLNKHVKVRGISEKTIVGGMSKYNDPAMSFMTDLFDVNAVKYMTIQFEQDIYTRYLESVINCDISIKGYSKTFTQTLRELCNWVYQSSMGNNSYRPQTSSYNNSAAFSASMNNTLNQMKRKY